MSCSIVKPNNYTCIKTKGEHKCLKISYPQSLFHQSWKYMENCGNLKFCVEEGG